MQELFGALLVMFGILGAGVAADRTPSRRRRGEVGPELRRPVHYPERNLPAPADRRALRVRTIGRRGRYKVVLVDGTEVRDRIDPDFTCGGNPGRYGYVPMDELWVDDCTAKGDVGPYVEHEAVESDLMLDHGLTYDEAHDRATLAERKLRKRPKADRDAFDGADGRRR